MSKNIQEYEKDFYAWTIHNAKLLREGRLSEVDLEHVAEEIESMGKSEKRELIHRLAVLISHILKWQFQPDKRSNSWKYTIKEQRIRLLSLLEDSPSLKNELEKKIEKAYEQAIVIALKQTHLKENLFSKKCPYPLKKILSDQFFPK